MSPLTSHNSEVGFSVTLGLLIGMGNTITKAPNMWSGTIPYLGMSHMSHICNESLFLEILRSDMPSIWIRTMNEYYNLEFHPPEKFNSLEYNQLISVIEHFPTMRRKLELLNHDYTKYCDNGQPIP